MESRFRLTLNTVATVAIAPRTWLYFCPVTGPVLCRIYRFHRVQFKPLGESVTVAMTVLHLH